MLLRAFDEEEIESIVFTCSYGADEPIMGNAAAALARTEADVNGRYYFSGIPDGAYLLMITAPGFAFTEETVTVVEADAKRSGLR